MTAPVGPDETAAPPGPSLEELWKRWAGGHDVETRNELVRHYFPLVRHVARQMATSLSHRVEVGDLEGYGAEGLLNAIERFDLARGVQFSTFAAYRIRGAIYDGIRGNDWVPRSVRRRERELRDNRAWLAAEFGRDPTESEEAALLGVSVETIRSIKEQISQAGVASLQSAAPGEERREAFEPTDQGAGPLDAWLTREVMLALREAIETLTERERLVIQLSFGAGETLAEIGRKLGVTESRVSQIRGSALRALRNHLDANGMVTA